MLRMLDKPSLPQLLADPPQPPAPNTAHSREHDEYGAFILTVLISDTELSALQDADSAATPWHMYLSWRARAERSTDEHDIVALAIMRKLADHAWAQARNRERIQAARADREAGRQPNDDPDDEDAERDTRDAFVEDEWEIDEDLAATAVTTTDAVRELLRVPPVGNSHQAAYHATVMGPLAAIGMDDLACHNNAGDSMRATPRDEAHVTAQMIVASEAAALDFDGYAQLRRNADESNHVDGRSLINEALHVLVGDELQPLAHGEVPPYRKVPTTPSIADVSNLFTLSADQEKPFVALADALAQERENIPVRSPIHL